MISRLHQGIHHTILRSANDSAMGNIMPVAPAVSDSQNPLIRVICLISHESIQKKVAMCHAACTTDSNSHWPKHMKKILLSEGTQF